jgi:ferredoxin
MKWATTRRIVQITSLFAFFVLTLAGVRQGAGWTPGTVFSRLDPLVGLSALAASKTLMTFWLAAGVTLGFTVVLGRVWCGWICPAGALIDLGPGRRRGKAKRLSPAWQLGKYVVLVVVLLAALLGNLGPMILDPITILTRPIQEIVRPMVGADANARAGIDASRGIAAVPAAALLSLLPLALVLGLNAVDKRFWCRGACPLGGLLAIVSLSPGIRRQVDGDKCTSCGKCAQVCPKDAISPEKGYASSVTECVTCLSCVDACPSSACGFPAKVSPDFVPPYAPQRREAVAAIGLTGLGVAGAMLPRVGPQPEIDRPPSTDDQRLSELCVRCGACYATCPTGILTPSMSFTSVAGPWTPALDRKRPSYCNLSCNRCANQCPTGALRPLTEDEKSYYGQGLTARAHLGMCIAFRQGTECLKCQKACPVPGAITGVPRPEFLAEKDAEKHGGRTKNAHVLVPQVDASKCIGCNQCEKACPVQDPPAIYVDRGQHRRK